MCCIVMGKTPEYINFKILPCQEVSEKSYKIPSLHIITLHVPS